jgi:transposase
MSTYSTHLGIDLAKDKFDVCLLTQPEQRHASFANSPKGFGQLLAWLKQHKAPDARACMEATGRYGHALAAFLYKKNIAVSVVNAAAIHFFARSQMSRNKTDAYDAQLIARYSRDYQPRLWQPRTPEIQQLQALVRTREQLVQSRVIARQRLSETPALTARFFREQIQLLARQIKAVEREIHSLAQGEGEMAQALQLLMSIPGIAQTTAATVLATMPEVEQLASARQLAAFAGVTPRQSQSGKSAGKTRLSKLGHSRLRKALYLPAVCALRRNPRVRALAQKLAEKGKAKMVIVGAAMRQLLHLCYGVLKNKTPFAADYLKATPAK